MSPRIHTETLTPNVIVFGDGDFERQLALDEVMRVGPDNRISAIQEEEETEVCLLSLPTMWEHNEKSQEDNPHHSLPILAPSRTVRREKPIVQATSLWHFVMTAQKTMTDFGTQL